MRGRTVSISAPRRIVVDLLHYAKKVPSIPLERPMALGELVAARAAWDDRPPWPVIFAKAFALLAAEVPDLRRVFIPWPFAHLYEYPKSVGALALERSFDGEEAVFLSLIKDPAQKSLREMTALMRHVGTAPIGEIKDFRRIVSIGRLPLPIRRLLWSVALNVGRFRASYLGTFCVSVVSAFGIDALHPLGPVTTFVNYGVFAPDGTVTVRFIFDHRVLDGAPAARALRRLEEILRGPILDELRAGGRAI